MAPASGETRIFSDLIFYQNSGKAAQRGIVEKIE
jgi:hypothetical protein